MISHLKRIFDYARPSAANGGLHFDRPLLLFQSDDWGRVGVRDREGWDALQAGGIALGESPYDFYSLETAEDVAALRELMGKHRDSAGRNPSIVMNFIMANVDMANVDAGNVDAANADFDRGPASPEKTIPLISLSDGLPGEWQRPYLFKAYQQGIKDGIFYPALHGLTHFCEKAVRRALEVGGERAESIRNESARNDSARKELLRKMWSAQTPYIYWRMPWIGYEYWDPAREPERRFLSLNDQRPIISRAAEIYRTLFAAPPFSACAPGYRANADTRTAWFDSGIRVAQNGPDRRAPHFDGQGMLHTFRTIEMEPALAPVNLKRTLEEAEQCFHRGLPAVVSIHSINFHSTIRDFRTPTLLLLDEFLTALEKKWPTLLYVNDADLFRIASEGMFFADGERVDVGVSAA